MDGVYFSDTNNGTAVGINGTILHTTNGGVTFIEEKQIDEIPTQFLLSNNWPNPFNPSTRIQYQVSSNTHVTLKVYDMLGREIATLVNEEKEPGIYRAEFNTQDYQLASGISAKGGYASGVYLYRLQAGNFVETKKMVLMK